MSGMIKMGVVGAACLYLYQSKIDELVPGAPPLTTLTSLAVAFYAYPAYVYFNFAGYCDIVIGSAALLGFTHQENFDRPYVARNLIDFWHRWHISLSMWIRDYVFMSSYK